MSRKLQKEIDIIFKKIQEGLHEFNYHYERYESLNSDEDSDNQREREKLENDLKKEIKRLQKFREQIKIWQLNDMIKSFGLATPQLSKKLNKNKRWIEDSMEIYKDVERASKLKTFSNQSIMMASLEQMRELDIDEDSDNEDLGWNSEEGLVDADEVLEHDDEDEELELATDFVEALEYFRHVLSQLNLQTKKLNAEYEKLCHKKLRKNNLSLIEGKKEKISSTKQTHSFHAKKILKLIRSIKANKPLDMNLIQIIQYDLNNYLNNNGNDDYDTDFSLYDDIFNLMGNRDQLNSEDGDDMRDIIQIKSPHGILPTLTSPTTFTPAVGDGDSRPVSISNVLLSGLQTHGSAPTRTVSSTPSTPISHYALESEYDIPGIVKVLKPASAPSKPLEGLKWLMAAAVGILETKSSISSCGKSPESPDSTRTSTSLSTSECDALRTKPVTVTSLPHSRISLISQNRVQVNSQSNSNQPNAYVSMLQNHEIFAGESNSKLFDVLNQLKIDKFEKSLFKDLNLVHVPPGIQDLVISFASKRNSSACSEFLSSQGEESYQYCTRINKPHLPFFVSQATSLKLKAKLPLQYFKLQQYWNKIRGSNLFSQFVKEIATANSLNVEANSIGEELTLVLFFGFYHGLTPMENLIAEKSLYQLGWRRYKVYPELNRNPVNGDKLMTSSTNFSSDSRHLYHWIKCMKIPHAEANTASIEDTGDYQVFDPLAWELLVQYSFKVDFLLCESAPWSQLC